MTGTVKVVLAYASEATVLIAVFPSVILPRILLMAGVSLSGARGVGWPMVRGVFKIEVSNTKCPKRVVFASRA